MSATKIVARVIGLTLLAVGLIGSAGSIFEIFDPVGSKLADDGKPFGPPSSLANSLLILLFYLGVCAVGTFLTWKSVRKPHVSA